MAFAFNKNTTFSGANAGLGNLHLLPLLLIMLLLTNCLPEPLEVKNVPTVKPQIVVATQMIPDQSLVVLLTRTFGALDASGDSDPEALLEQIAVNDAVVTISSATGTDTLLFLDSGFYGGISIPFAEGQTYELRVKSETLGEVYASTTVQPRIPFKEVDALIYYNDFDDSLAQITYSLTDPGGNNWYLLNVQHLARENLLDNVLNPRAYLKLFEDDPFEGQVYAEQFRLMNRDYAPGDTVAISISNISQEYHDFMQVRLDNRFSFMEFVGEPVNYTSNVVGGRGYFNLYIPDIRFIVLEDSPDQAEGQYQRLLFSSSKRQIHFSIVQTSL